MRNKTLALLTWPGHPFLMVRSSSLPGHPFSIWTLTLWLARPRQLGQCETIRACASAVDSGKRVNLFLILTLVSTIRGRPWLHSKLNLNIANFLGLLIDKLENYQQHFPGQDDLEGAMAAINRLQDVYRLTPYDFTGGKYGIRSDSGSFLSAMDAYKFGRGAFGSEDMENTQRWMAESLRLMDMEPDNQKEKPNRFSVLDHLAWSSYQVILSLG